MTATMSERSGYGFGFLVGENCFSLRYGTQKDPGADAAFYPARTGDLSTKVKGLDRENDHH